MSSFRFPVLFLCFFLDVHVKAEECWGKTLPCAIRAKSQRRILSAASGGSLVLAPNAMIEMREAHELRLVRGQLYAESKSRISISSPFGSLECLADCRAIFLRSEASLRVESLGGSWVIFRRGDQSPYGLVAGMQVLLAEVGDNGKAEMGFPHALPLESVLKSWARLYPGSRSEFRDEVRLFREVWLKSVEKAAEIQSAEAGRQIANHEADLAKARARQRAEHDEDESLRKLFREKNDIQP